jgi:hypothetical protein
MTTKRAPAMAMLALTAACTSVHSDSIKTSGMSGHFTVTANGSAQTTVTASLWVDDNSTDTVDLTSGDTLTASAAGQQPQTMAREDSLGAISYDATFTGHDGANTPYTIALRRPNDVSAPGSVCSLPAPLTVTSPAPGAAFSRARDVISIVYGPSGGSDAMSLSVSGACVDYTLSFADTGSVTIARGALLANGQSSAACEATLTISRSRAGSVDPAYGYGGSMSCEQVRSITFTSSP